jgi:Domain of unknown function (DUF4248)
MKSTTMKEDKFVVRAFGFGELAQLYFPSITQKSASAQLRKWIESDIFLSKELSHVGYKFSQRLLTPRQVRTIIQILGEPQ